MPLYEYKCDECGQVFEVIERFSDDPLKVHEGCGGAVHRLLSAPALQFKGSGWYVNDYAKGGKSNGKAKDTAAAPAKTDTAASTSSTPAATTPSDKK